MKSRAAGTVLARFQKEGFRKWWPRLSLTRMERSESLTRHLTCLYIDGSGNIRGLVCLATARLYVLQTPSAEGLRPRKSSRSGGQCGTYRQPNRTSGFQLRREAKPVLSLGACVFTNAPLSQYLGLVSSCAASLLHFAEICQEGELPTYSHFLLLPDTVGD